MASGAQLTLRVITPDAIVLDEPVSSVRIPGLDGSLGILPRHAQMVAALDAGLLRYRNGGADHFMYVSPGFAEVRDDTLRVVCEAASAVEDIDPERARAAEKRARERLEQARTGGPEAKEIDVARAEAALQRALMRLQVLDIASRLGR
jgi:F-type H+-transporting ATPase subunit epsilon